MQTITLVDIARFDFNLVVTFLALWEERSVSKAAQRLSLSQSAVSTALARLREAAGDPLFVRTQRGMQPTARAIAMAAPLGNGAELIRRAFMPVAPFDPMSSHQHFSIGMSDDFQIAIGPILSRRLAIEAPGVSVTFRQSNRHMVTSLFEAGEIDFAMVAGASVRSGLAREDIGQSGYACLIDARHCGVALPLSLEDYLSLPHVLVSFSGREGIVDDALRTLSLKRRVQSALTHFSALPAFLIGHRAVATLPAHAARQIAAFSGLSVCPPPVALGRYNVSLLWQRTQDNPWMRRMMIDAFETALSEETDSIPHAG